MEQQPNSIFQSFADKENNGIGGLNENFRNINKSKLKANNIARADGQANDSLRLSKRYPLGELNMESINNVKIFTGGYLVDKIMCTKMSVGKDSMIKDLHSAKITPYKSSIIDSDLQIITKHTSVANVDIQSRNNSYEKSGINSNENEASTMIIEPAIKIDESKSNKSNTMQNYKCDVADIVTIGVDDQYTPTDQKIKNNIGSFIYYDNSYNTRIIGQKSVHEDEFFENEINHINKEYLEAESLKMLDTHRQESETSMELKVFDQIQDLNTSKILEDMTLQKSDWTNIKMEICSAEYEGLNNIMEEEEEEEQIEQKYFVDSDCKAIEPQLSEPNLTQNLSYPTSPFFSSTEMQESQSPAPILNLKTMSKDQIFSTINRLIETNKSIVSSDSLSLLSRRTSFTTEYVFDTKDKRKFSTVNSLINPSSMFAAEMKTSIHQSLKAFHNTIQTSEANASKSKFDEKSCFFAPNQKSETHGCQFSGENMNEILRDLDQDEKKKASDSLDIILQEKLENEFKLKSMWKSQIDIVKKVLNKESCLYRHINPVDHNIAYQLPALLTKNLILYISSSVCQMAEQIQTLPPSLYGACYNGFSSRENNKQVLELVEAKQIRILFVTSDKVDEVLQASLPIIDYIVLDVTSLQEDQIQSSQKVLSEAALAQKISSWPRLVLIPPVSVETCLDACQTYKISDESIFPAELSLQKAAKFSISRDDDPNRALLALLRNEKFHDGKCVVIYTDAKRTAEELSIFLTHNSIKNQLVLPGRTELQKLDVYKAFLKNNDQAIVTVSGIDIGLDRSLIKRVVHYNIPRTPELIAQEMLYLHNDSKGHIFISDEDFFRGRNNILAETIYRDQVERFIKKVFKPPLSTLPQTQAIASKPKEPEPIESLLNKRKRDGSLIPKNSATSSFNPFISKALTLAKSEEQERVRVSMLVGQTLNIKVSELNQQLVLKKDAINYLFEQLESLVSWIEYIGISPYSCNIRFLQPTKEENCHIQSTKEEVLNLISAKNKKEAGITRVFLPSIAAEAKVTIVEVFKQLKNLQNEGFIRYDIVDEVFQYKIKREPATSDFRDIITLINERASQKVNRAIGKIDFCYAICKLSSIQTIDHMTKQNKDVRMRASKKVNSVQNLPKDSDVLDYTERKILKKNSREDFLQNIEKYLNSFGKNIDLILDYNAKSKNELPLLRTMTQRERTLLQAELQCFFTEYLDIIGGVDSGIFDPKNITSEESKQFLTRQAVRVALGISLANSSYEWKTMKLWRRYHKFDPNELRQLFYEALQNLTLAGKHLKKSK